MRAAIEMEQPIERSPAAAPGALASLGDRMLGQAVDGLVGFGVFFFVGAQLATRYGGETESGFHLTGWPAVVGLSIVSLVMLAYFIILEGVFGATPGKLVVGIRVAGADGARAGFRSVLIRNLLRVVDAVGVYLVGGLVALLTRRRQRLGDLAAGTVVVRAESGRVARVAALVVALSAAVAGVWGALALRTGSSAAPAAEANAAKAQAAEADAGAFADYAPEDPSAAIEAVSLTLGEGEKFDPSRAGREFAEGVSRIFVWYRWAGAEPGRRVDIHWYRDGAKVLEQGEEFAGPSGSDAWYLSMAEGGALPAGSYEVKLLENGSEVTSIPFRIAAAPGESSTGKEAAPSESGQARGPEVDPLGFSLPSLGGFESEGTQQISLRS